MKQDVEERRMLLQSVSLFSSLPHKELTELATWSSRISYKKGYVMVSEGTAGRGLYVLIHGKAKVSVRAGNKEKVVATLGPLDFFGEMSLIERAPRSSSVIALEDTDCLFLDSDMFLQKMSARPKMMIVLLKTICRRLRKLLQELRGF